MQKIVVYEDAAGEAARGKQMDEMQEKGWLITSMQLKTIKLMIVVYDTKEKGTAW